MDNIFNESDYSDINSKYLQYNNNNKKFNEIDIKQGNCGFIKLIVLFLLFILLLILAIVAIVKTSSIKSQEQKINENKEQLTTNKKSLSEKEELLKTLEKNNNELEYKLNIAINERIKMDNNMKIYLDENDIIKIDIMTLEKELEDLNQKIKIYEGLEKSEIQLEYENLIDKIERLKQSPM